MLAQTHAKSLITIRNRKPRHSSIIFAELLFSLVEAHKNDFQLLATAVYLIVEEFKLWSESSARRTPVS